MKKMWIWKHFCTITKHKIHVMDACFRAGLFWRGLMHDVSKYSPTEFLPSARYFQGDSSPINAEKTQKGYSAAWQHHKGHNPHHYEYWLDNLDVGGTPLIIPYKYAVEMVCDFIGAGKAYNKSKWTISEPLSYWKNIRKTAKIHPRMIAFFDDAFTHFATVGYKALKKETLLLTYRGCVENGNIICFPTLIEKEV